MPYSYYDYTIVDVNETEYTATINFLLSDHISVWYKEAADLDFTEQEKDVDYTFSGTSGAILITLDALSPSAGGTLRIKRTTPATKDGRLVDFQAGSLTEEDLDTTFLQCLYITQEALDELETKLGVSPDDFLNWSAEDLRIRDLAKPVNASDAARLQDVQEVALSSGNLPGPDLGKEGDMLQIVSNAWAVVGAAQVVSGLGLGTAALQDVGYGEDELGYWKHLKGAFLQITNDLSDLASASTARTNLGLGTAAVEDAGVSAGNLVQLNGSAQLPAVDGSLLTGLASSGALQVFARIPITTTTGLNTSTWAKMNLSSMSSFNNAGEITSSTSTDTVTLQNNGNYIIEVKVGGKNQGANTATFFWQLVEQSPGSTSWLTSGTLIPSAGQFIYSSGTTMVFPTAGNMTLQVQGRDIGAPAGDVQVFEGEIVIWKVAS